MPRYISRLTLGNFKPFSSRPDTSFRLAPITLIYGPNSAGKSSIVQAIRLLKQSRETFLKTQSSNVDLTTRGDQIDLGSYLSVLHQHDPSRKLTLGLQFSDYSKELNPGTVDIKFGYTTTQSPVGCTGELSSVNLTFRNIPHHNNKTLYHNGEVCLERQERDPSHLQSALRKHDRSARKWPGGAFAATKLQLSGMFPPDNKQNNKFAAKLNEALKKIYFCRKSPSTIGPQEALFFGGGYIPAPYILKKEKEEPAISATKDLLSDTNDKRKSQWDVSAFRLMATATMPFDFASSTLASGLRNISYLGPLRAAPERIYELSDDTVDSVGKRGENAVNLLYKDALSSKGGGYLKSSLNHFFSRFGIPYTLEFHPFSSGREELSQRVFALSLRDKKNISLRVSPTDVGTGIGQLLPILVEGIVACHSKTSNRNSAKIICVEQPELHLHPKLQAELADFFIATNVGAMKTGKAKRSRFEGSVQWILETHSETLMLRLQRRIREGALKFDDISVIYVNPKPRGGATAFELRLDENGDFIDEWPAGFFEESFNEKFGI